MSTKRDGDANAGSHEKAVLFDWLRGMQAVNDVEKVFTATELGVLLMAATFADTNTGKKIRPGIRVLSKRSGSTPATVTRTLAKARELGVIERTFEHPKGSALADEHRLCRSDRWQIDVARVGADIDNHSEEVMVDIDHRVLSISTTQLLTSTQDSSTQIPATSTEVGENEMAGTAWAKAERLITEERATASAHAPEIEKEGQEVPVVDAWANARISPRVADDSEGEETEGRGQGVIAPKLSRPSAI